ncbi:hypothetical protein ACFL9T_05125 [Thermodesulfobacteriota bacterium]
MKIYLIAILTLSASLFLLRHAAALESVFSGQLSGWTIENYSREEWNNTSGLRYIPQLNLLHSINEDSTLDAEVSIDALFSSDEDDKDNHYDIDFYRLWLRYAASQYEVRAGLQKISFGSAMLLRPLMWFDQLDPRDPLQLTDGVYGLLFRYYFLNNANIWLWGLYGNDDPKGWELIPSDPRRPELGGRLQIPLFSGEMALSYHHRKADLNEGLFGLIPLGDQSISENRIGLDGKWDIGVGIWFEGAFIHKDVDTPGYPYLTLVDVGMDYTFNLGNGLTTLMEYFVFNMSEHAFGSSEKNSLLALSLNYPMGMLDNLSGIVYYDREQSEWYRYVNWQRKYDQWAFNIIGFWNPDQFQLFQGAAEHTQFSGKGIQLLVVFNH